MSTFFAYSFFQIPSIHYASFTLRPTVQLELISPIASVYADSFADDGIQESDDLDIAVIPLPPSPGAVVTPSSTDAFVNELFENDDSEGVPDSRVITSISIFLLVFFSACSRLVIHYCIGKRRRVR